MGPMLAGLCVLGAILMGVNGQGGWGWFLLAAILLG